MIEGDPSGFPNKKGMTVISDRNYNVQAGDPAVFLALAQQLYGDTPMMTRICMHKSHVEY